MGDLKFSFKKSLNGHISIFHQCLALQSYRTSTLSKLSIFNGKWTSAPGYKQFVRWKEIISWKPSEGSSISTNSMRKEHVGDLRRRLLDGFIPWDVFYRFVRLRKTKDFQETTHRRGFRPESTGSKVCKDISDSKQLVSDQQNRQF